MSGSGAGASPEPYRRFEVYTGTGRRRTFTTEEKLGFVAQMSGCDNISEMARRCDLRPSQLFTWRRELRYAGEVAQSVVQIPPKPLFVPAVIEPEPVTAVAPKKQRTRHARSSAAVELVIDGVAVKIAQGADASVIAAVIDALKTRA